MIMCSMKYSRASFFFLFLFGRPQADPRLWLGGRYDRGASPTQRMAMGEGGLTFKSKMIVSDRRRGVDRYFNGNQAMTKIGGLGSDNGTFPILLRGNAC